MEHAYVIRIFPIMDYRLVTAQLQEPFFEKKPAGRLRARRFEKRRESLWREFQGELAALLDERDENYCFAAGNLPPEADIRRLVPLPLFDGYTEQRWVWRLLSYAVHPNFIVLGTNAGLPKLLCRLTPRMKSMVWVLPDHPQRAALEDFAEEFYLEYGLAIDLRSLEFGGSYGRLQMEELRRGPVNVLDFTPEKRIPRLEICPGSVWIDMTSEGEKEKRIEARQPGIFYISLKKQWEQPEKAAFLLDTVGKNGYNT